MKAPSLKAPIGANVATIVALSIFCHISQKMLTSTLKTLEADGYVNRKVYAEVPPRVEYSLTTRSETLIPIMNSLIEWAGDNMAMILKDRQQKAV